MEIGDRRLEIGGRKFVGISEIRGGDRRSEIGDREFVEISEIRGGEWRLGRLCQMADVLVDCQPTDEVRG